MYMMLRMKRMLRNKRRKAEADGSGATKQKEESYLASSILYRWMFSGNSVLTQIKVNELI